MNIQQNLAKIKHLKTLCEKHSTCESFEETSESYVAHVRSVSGLTRIEISHAKGKLRALRIMAYRIWREKQKGPIVGNDKVNKG